VFSVKSHGILAFQVIDDGVGIPADQCDRLFKPFSQLASSSMEEPGSGLGLAICKSLSMLMGGDVNMTSVVGIGSVFNVEVGFETVEDDDTTTEFNITPGITGKTVLVISDVIDVRMSLMKLFGDVDITCVSFSTLEEAIYVINQKSYDLDIVLIQDSMGREFEDNVQHLLPLVPLIIVGKKTCVVSKLQGQVDIPICRTQVLERVENVIRLHHISDMNATMPPKPPSPKTYDDLDARILICEDSAHNREILQLMLKRMGFKNIDTVSNGADGIRMIDESTIPYDLLYLDLSMPVVNGYDVIRHIQDNNLWLPKIIVVTASVLQGEQDRCKSMGVNYFLKKPYCSESLKVVTFQSLSSIDKRA
jgi:CheY-like chemotaxis protein